MARENALQYLPIDSARTTRWSLAWIASSSKLLRSEAVCRLASRESYCRFVRDHAISPLSF